MKPFFRIAGDFLTRPLKNVAQAFKAVAILLLMGATLGCFAPRHVIVSDPALVRSDPVYHQERLNNYLAAEAGVRAKGGYAPLPYPYSNIYFSESRQGLGGRGNLYFRGQLGGSAHRDPSRPFEGFKNSRGFKFNVR